MYRTKVQYKEIIMGGMAGGNHDEIPLDFDTTVAEEATRYLSQREAAKRYRSEEPRPGECLRCYLERLLVQYGCRGDNRWLRRWLETTETPLAEVICRPGMFTMCDCIALTAITRGQSEPAYSGRLCAIMDGCWPELDSPRTRRR